MKDSALPSVKVHATVVFSILNNFTRRSPRDSRVIGTLLGEVRDGVVVVSLSLVVFAMCDSPAPVGVVGDRLFCRTFHGKDRRIGGCS